MTLARPSVALFQPISRRISVEMFYEERTQHNINIS